MAVVSASHLPAPRPKLAMAGVIRAKIRTGTKNPRKLPNRPLTVAKNRPSHSGAKKLTMMPRMIAMTILNSSDCVTRLAFIKVSITNNWRDTTNYKERNLYAACVVKTCGELVGEFCS